MTIILLLAVFAKKVLIKVKSSYLNLQKQAKTLGTFQ